jgi:hypothetical protein
MTHKDAVLDVLILMTCYSVGLVLCLASDLHIALGYFIGVVVGTVSVFLVLERYLLRQISS